MALGDEDVAVRRDEHVVRLDRRTRARAAPPALPSVISTLPSGLNLMTWCPMFVGGGAGSGASAARRAAAPRRVVLAVGHPDVAVAIDVMPCGKINMPAPKLFTSLPVASNFSTESGQTFCRSRDRARVRAAALGDPDGRAVLVDVDRAGRAPRAALGQFRPAFDRLIRVRQVVGRRDGGLRKDGAAD